MRGALRACADAEPEVLDSWSVVFEFELPCEGGRRPDVVVLAGSSVVVIEFKSTAAPTIAHLDQVRGYARDLGDYHRATHGRVVQPVLVCGGAAPGFARVIDEVVVCEPGELHRYLYDVAGEGFIDLAAWLDAPYEPLPTLVEAARRIFRHEPLPHVKSALSAGVPETVELLGKLCEEAEAEGLRIFALVAGVPGSGKTLVGLRLVYERTQALGRATFLSGNGPLVAVLQDALGSTVFVRDLHRFVRTYGINRRTPTEHVIVFDEAQRAWDAGYMLAQRSVKASEPELLISAAERIPVWASLVGLVGEGQEIHSGEEGGIEKWRAALSPGWRIHCPPRLAPGFPGLPVTTHERLDLTLTLRSRRAQDLHDWVRLLLEGSIPLAARLAIRVHRQGFAMYVTRDLDQAKDYARALYEEAPTRTYGLLASSHATSLPQWGVDNSYLATSRMNVAKWFNAPRGDPRSCTALSRPVTEFGCQGLELDLPIVCWGEDLAWESGAWQVRPVRRRYPLKDPETVVRNVYRVLLTRGRDGLVVWIPPASSLDETEHILLAAGLRPLPEVVAEALEQGASGA